MYEIANRKRKWGTLIIFLMTPLCVAAERSFQSDVQRIKCWQQRDKSSLIALDNLGKELINRYQEPQQQGEIYYYLAHHHAQGGLIFPQEVVDYASKALACPLTPDQKMRLCVYRGDAFQVLNRKKPFTERRREAVISYFQGLKDLKKFHLPDTPPNIPNTPPTPKIFEMSTGKEADRAQRKFEEDQKRYLEERDRAEFTRTMMMHRDVLQGQIVALYGRRPVATEELREMATRILGEGKELDRLMVAVNDKVAKLPPEEKSTLTPVENPVPASASKYRYLLAVLGAGAALAALLLLLSRWRRGQRQADSTTVQ